MPQMPDVDFDADEQKLAELIADYADRSVRGESLDLEQACQQHPAFETDLRELWGTVVVANAAGREQRDLELPSTGELRVPRLELPCAFSSYVLEAEIGRGGMGIVYRATRSSDGEPVAIKMILKGDFATDAEKQRFDAESEAAARLNHPNIVPIYEVGEHEGRAFFCMKLIRGQSLAERLVRGPMANEKAASVMNDICSAIEYAHQQGILHRDLKPSNIMLDDDNCAYIADFGLAKNSTGNQVSLTKTGAVMGTPSYMAPEQAAGERGRLGPLTDVYSLGAILYHMLTGRPPFLGASPVDTIMMVLEQDPVSPRAINRRADRQLEIICMTCMQKPQDLRYQSAGELTADVNAVQNGDPVKARLGRFGQVISNLFRETHHAAVLENWGLLWMWHSLVLFIACVVTEIMFWMGDEVRWHYWLMWTFGLGAWAIVFWMVRRTMGPVTFVERQIAHVWAASMFCVAFLFPLEMSLGLEVLQLAPLLGVMAGMVFLIKAGTLSGSFYYQATAMFITAIFMKIYPGCAMLQFGVVSGLCFFTAGLKYYRRKKKRASWD